jgi:hypothetical protein
VNQDDYDQRAVRANTICYLTDHGAVEGQDWRFADSVDAWDGLGIVDSGSTVEVTERLVPKDRRAIPILVRSSVARMLGAPRLAAAMDEGMFPAEMPFVISSPGSAN